MLALWASCNGMDAKRRAGGATISLAWIAGFGRELVTLPPDKTLDMLGDVISPYSFYLALTVLGLGGFVYFGWPVAQWVWQVPVRRQARQQERRVREEEGRLAEERQMNKQVIDDLETLQQCINAELKRHPRINHIENRETIRILTDELKAMGFNLPLADDEHLYPRLFNSVSGLLPRVRLYGVKRVLCDMGEI